jgi:hypothetical protein
MVYINRDSCIYVAMKYFFSIFFVLQKHNYLHTINAVTQYNIKIIFDNPQTIKVELINMRQYHSPRNTYT